MIETSAMKEVNLLVPIFSFLPMLKNTGEHSHNWENWHKVVLLKTQSLTLNQKQHCLVSAWIKIKHSKIFQKSKMFLTLWSLLINRLLQGQQATTRRQITFDPLVSRNSWYSVWWPWKDERLTCPWNWRFWTWY